MSEYLKEIIRLKGQISKMEATLSDEKFLSKAPHNVIEINKKKLSYFNNVLNRTMDELVGATRRRFNHDDGLEGIDAVDRITWYLQWLRDGKLLVGEHFDFTQEIDYSKCEFDEKYFNYIYKTNATQEELAELCDLTDKLKKYA